MVLGFNNGFKKFGHPVLFHLLDGIINATINGIITINGVSTKMHTWEGTSIVTRTAVRRAFFNCTLSCLHVISPCEFLSGQLQLILAHGRNLDIRNMTGRLLL